MIINCNIIKMMFNRNSYIKNSIPVINSLGNEIIELPVSMAKKKYPIVNFEGVNEVYLEKKAGILLASRCCKKVVKEFQKIGGSLTLGEVKVEENKLNKGDILCLAAFGSGFTWASALIKW